VKVERLNKLIKKLENLRDKAKKDSEAGVQVGFTQRYALYVHEDLNARHGPGKQAKFLEDPARSQQHTLRSIVYEVYQKTKSMSKALLVAGLRLLRESQKIVPIDTGALRTSGYVALEQEAETVAQAAYELGEALRNITKGTSTNLAKDVELLRKSNIRVPRGRRKK
jgi:predicted transcriptional regulator